MSDSLGSLFHRLSGVYRDPQRVLRDAETLLSSPLGSHLRPTTEPLTLNDGSSTPPVLLLRGTIPMTYKGVTYNLPIDLYLPPPYPLRPPTVFVRPVAGMSIKENHRHVGLDGRVYLPYLHDWRPGTHELRELAVWMSSLFGSEPPCYATPGGASGGGASGAATAGAGDPPPPPYATASSASAAASLVGSSRVGAAYGSLSAAASSATSGLMAEWQKPKAGHNAEEERRKALEKEVAEANLAAQVAREESLREAQMAAEQKRLQQEHAQKLSEARAVATSKVRHEVRALFRETKEELRAELRSQKRLEHGKEQIAKVLEERKSRKERLEKDIGEVDEAAEGLEKWLAAVEEQRRRSASEDGEGGGTSKSKADAMATPADTHSAQMLALSAENAAIDDCVYCLDQALVRGCIPVEVFLKEVRRLSKRQFMAKAHLIKIAQTRAAERG